MPVDFLKAKQGYTARKTDKDKWIGLYYISADMKFRNKNKFRYGIPAFTGPFRALVAGGKRLVNIHFLVFFS
jgi:hypothetical protein